LNREIKELKEQIKKLESDFESTKLREGNLKQESDRLNLELATLKG